MHLVFVGLRARLEAFSTSRKENFFALCERTNQKMPSAHVTQKVTSVARLMATKRSFLSERRIILHQEENNSFTIEK